MKSMARYQLLIIRSAFGYTLVELLTVMGIVAILAALATPAFAKYLERTRYARCVVEIEAIAKEVSVYFVENLVYPDTLDQVDMAGIKDPWGNPYQYLKIAGASNKGKGNVRKDKFMVPINSDFDLYSMGPDGLSVSPLTAKQSRDDIIRANDGGYVGRATGY